VYLGRDTAINRLVAIKAIPLAQEFSDSDVGEARTRFFREAETAGRLNHPNIVTIYDVGEEGNLAYIAMEYLKGRHLSDFVNPSSLLPAEKVLDLVSRTANALGFAHRQDVIHRDIKPANLMYDAAADTLKITDFGIARLTDSANTRTGIVLGTPSFMSPEQLEGRIVNGRSDLFALGVTLFQLLTGQLPFRADSMTALMQQIAEFPHPPLGTIRLDLPDCVGSIIDRALAKNPESRFETGAQMAAALDDCRAASFRAPA
jgi:eukaryotic-like serine/threonine-protein kinase